MAELEAIVPDYLWGGAPQPAPRDRVPAGPDAAGFLSARPRELYATVEVAAAVGRSERTVVSQLEDLLENGPIRRAAAAARELWSWGPPAFELRCPRRPTAGRAP